MKVLIDSYNTSTQGESGGVQIKIKNYYTELKKRNIDVTLYDKWNHKIKDFDLIHIFKSSVDSYSMINYARSIDVPIVISSIIPLAYKSKILFSNFMNHFHIHTPYDLIRNNMLTADAVIAETEREANFIKKHYGVRKVHTIPNGVTINFQQSLINEFCNRTGIKEKFVLQVGRFDSNKNQLNVIKAMQNSKIPVVFIGGEFQDEPEYFKQCKKIATGNMHFLDWIDHNDCLLSSAYQNAQVVILPSYKETFGMALIEGGAAGANLIATKELPIFDWGLYDFCKSINPSDVNDIRIKITEAYNAPKNPLIRDRIYQLFSWEKVIDEHINIYNNIIRGK